MLPYDTERHARGIFAKLVVGWSRDKGATPSEAEANALATAAVRISQDFAEVANRFSLPHSGTGLPQICKVLTFEQLVHEWQRHTLKSWEKRERNKVLSRFQRYLFPTLAGRPATEIAAPEIAAALRSVEDAGFLPLAHLILREIGRLYRFAIASGYALYNPAAEMKTALYRWRPRRRATILVPTRIGELLRAIDSYDGHTSAKYMLQIMPLVFVRPSELREAEWAEIDLKAAEWRIPARRMKARRPHIVPLSIQAKALFRKVYRMTGTGHFVFAGRISEDSVISDGQFKAMLRIIGFQGEMTPSGFRSMAATLLSEQGWNPDAIERQLSHADPRSMPRAYNFAEYLVERRRMMQWWADYLDNLAGRRERSRPSSNRQTEHIVR